ncbi:MAG TPA: aminotransferase class III-fold pyridoxal phosphate-dependent enzyme, partial [Chloroflexota bacterium]
PFNDVEALRQAVGPKTCAVMFEVVQGESGVNIADPAFVEEARRLCDQSGALMILDEVQTGIGRTGKFMGYQHYGVEPDVFSLAKGLGGGVPIGAGVAKERAAVLEPSDHGSTFGGNPLACAAGVATIRTILRDKLVENAAAQGKRFAEKLSALKAKNSQIARVREKGLMVAFDTTEEVAPKVVTEALERGLILNATGPTTVRMVPPLIISAAEVDQSVEIIAEALGAV